jgi:hypothetical protein
MVKPEYVRMAWQSAVGSGLKFPSPDFDEYVAKFLNGLREVEVVKPTE